MWSDAESTARGLPESRAADVAYANRLGYSVKLLAVAELVDGGPELSVRVHPAIGAEGAPVWHRFAVHSMRCSSKEPSAVS